MLLTYLFRHISTYLQPQDPHGAHADLCALNCVHLSCTRNRYFEACNGGYDLIKYSEQSLITTFIINSFLQIYTIHSYYYKINTAKMCKLIYVNMQLNLHISKSKGQARHVQ